MGKELNELEFLGVQYLYELNMSIHKNNVRKVFSILVERFGSDIIEAYIKECKIKYPGHPVYSNL